jgi:hypothetical protein
MHRLREWVRRIGHGRGMDGSPLSLWVSSAVCPTVINATHWNSPVGRQNPSEGVPISKTVRYGTRTDIISDIDVDRDY